jgi:hypothetical protein
VELPLMRSLPAHPHVVRYLGVAVHPGEGGHIIMLMELGVSTLGACNEQM